MFLYSPFQPTMHERLRCVKKENEFFLNYWHTLNEVFDNPSIATKNISHKKETWMMNSTFSRKILENINGHLYKGKEKNEISALLCKKMLFIIYSKIFNIEFLNVV